MTPRNVGREGVTAIHDDARMQESDAGQIARGFQG